MDANSPNIEKARDALDTFLRGSMSQMDIHGIFRYLAEHEADKNLALMSEVFGKNHAPKMIALINAYRQGLYDQRNKLIGEREHGAAQAYADTLQEGLPGALHRLASAWDHMGEVLFVNTGLIDHVAGAFERLRGTLSALRDANPAILKTLGYGLAGLLSAGAAAIAFDALRIAAKGLKLALVLVGGPLRIAAAGLAALAYFKWDAIKAGWKDFSSGFSTGFWDNLKIPDSVGQSWERLKHAIEDISGSKLDLPSWRELGHSVRHRSRIRRQPPGRRLRGGMHWHYEGNRARNERGGCIRSRGQHQARRRKQRYQKGPASELPRKGGGRPCHGWPAHVVGERGPEMFVPRSSGSIVPNGARASAGGVTVHQTFNIKSSGDIATILTEVRREMRSGIDELFRGAQADVGLRWA